MHVSSTNVSPYWMVTWTLVWTLFALSAHFASLFVKAPVSAFPVWRGRARARQRISRRNVLSVAFCVTVKNIFRVAVSGGRCACRRVLRRGVWGALCLSAHFASQGLETQPLSAHFASQCLETPCLSAKCVTRSGNAALVSAFRVTVSGNALPVSAFRVTVSGNAVACHGILRHHVW